VPPAIFGTLEIRALPDLDAYGDPENRGIAHYHNPIWNLIHLIPLIMVVSALYMEKNRGAGVSKMLVIPVAGYAAIFALQHLFYHLGWPGRVPLLDGALMAVVAAGAVWARSGEYQDKGREGFSMAAGLAVPAAAVFAFITTGLNAGLIYGAALSGLLVSVLIEAVAAENAKSALFLKLPAGLILFTVAYLAWRFSMVHRQNPDSLLNLAGDFAAAALVSGFMALLALAFLWLTRRTPVFMQRLAGRDR
jgi:hypothetical protein